MTKIINSKFLQGIDYLKSKNSIFNNIYNDIGNLNFKIEIFDLTSFCKIIIGQQLSSEAANTIFSRLHKCLRKKK